MRLRQKVAIELLKIAGYHSDYKSWAKISAENHISFNLARKCWLSGVIMKRKGLRCTAGICNGSGESEGEKQNAI